jgi:tetratricopeptide (TPR) repeat protein
MFGNSVFRAIVLLYSASLLQAQPFRQGQPFGQPQQQTPLQAALQAYQAAHQAGRFDDAAAAREQARRLLSAMPPDDPMFANLAQTLAQFYQNAGFRAQARAVLQDALARAAQLGESFPAHIDLLADMANELEQDRNLLAALSYREQQAAAIEAPPAASPRPMQRQAQMVVMGAFRSGLADFGGPPNGTYVYQQLASLYRRLGRPQDATAVFARAAAHSAGNDSALAQLYEQQGQFDEAAKLYQRQAQQAQDRSQAVAPLEALANLYQREKRWDDAIGAMQQAIAAVESTGPQGHNQSLWMRQNLARYYQSAGKTQAGDQLYQQMLADTADPSNATQVMVSYSGYLSSTGRSSQAESALNQYLASHSDLQPWQETNVFNSLANAARMGGNPQRAQQYDDAARAKQPVPAFAPDGQPRLSDYMSQATTAVNSGQFGEALAATMQAIAAAPRAPDRESIMSSAPYIASALAFRQAPEKAEQIYQELFQLAQSWSADTVQPLISVQQSYSGFLLQQQRWGELDRQLERYRDTIVAAGGAQSAFLEDVLHLSIDSARNRNRLKDAVTLSQGLADREESLSGNTSEPYFQVIQLQAQLMESSGDYLRAIPVRKKAIAIADLVSGLSDWRPGQTRIDAALALAHEREFDEAETLARAAAALGETMPPPLPRIAFSSQLDQIARMKKAAQSAPASPAPGVPGSMLTGLPGSTPFAAPPPAPAKQIHP